MQARLLGRAYGFKSINLLLDKALGKESNPKRIFWAQAALAGRRRGLQVEGAESSSS